MLLVPLSGHLLIAGAFCLLAEPKALVVSLCARLVDRAVIEAEVGGLEDFRIPAVVFDGMCLSRRNGRRNGERGRSDWKCHGALTQTCDIDVSISSRCGTRHDDVEEVAAALMLQRLQSAEIVRASIKYMKPK